MKYESDLFKSYFKVLETMDGGYVNNYQVVNNFSDIFPGFVVLVSFKLPYNPVLLMNCR